MVVNRFFGRIHQRRFVGFVVAKELGTLNTLDLNALQKITAQAQKLQAIAKDVMPFIEALRDLDTINLPADRLVRTNEAAHILGVSHSTIGAFVKAGLLTPFYVNSDQRRFWLSEVKSLPRKKPWRIEQ